MSSSAAQRRRRQGGQALLELALVLGFLLVVLLGLVEFGLLIHAHVQVANATREGSRAASLYRSTRYREVLLDSEGRPPACDTLNGQPVEGWSLQQAVDQAMVYRQLETRGCPAARNDTSKPVIYTSLGRLETDPARWRVLISPGQESFCSSSQACMPTAGTTGTLRLDYEHRLVLASSLLPVLPDPITIIKTLAFEYQQ